MNDDFVSLFAYNRWADRRILDACRKLTPEQYATEPVPGWSSIRSSLVHIAIVIDGWVRGVTGETVNVVPTEEEMPEVDDIERLLDRAFQNFNSLLPLLTPERLATPMTLRKGTRSVDLPPWVVLRHVVNHSSYHRGQVASKLRMLGVDPPATDLSLWAFENLASKA
jgi:uncharacterized damage-inducible protein DinB